ncbi:MAG: hypothetical protein AAB617_00350 [Patescibacteria group bacterium]
MNTKHRQIAIWTLVILVIVGGIVYGRYSQNQPGKYGPFAQCLKESGATFYGAFWCPHCQTQKKMFGGAQKLLPYVECSTPDGQGQLDICKAKGIKGYPTWEFKDGSRETNVFSFEELSLKTNCSLPQ